MLSVCSFDDQIPALKVQIHYQKHKTTTVTPAHVQRGLTMAIKQAKIILTTNFQRLFQANKKKPICITVTHYNVYGYTNMIYYVPLSISLLVELDASGLISVLLVQTKGLEWTQGTVNIDDTFLLMHIMLHYSYSSTHTVHKFIS